jgi:hypothetical protein
MARCLTDLELSNLNAGSLPVLSCTPSTADELEWCIGWARDEFEALEMMRSHADVMMVIELPGLPAATLSRATKRPICIGDEDGVHLPNLRRCHPGTYFIIQAYVPTYNPWP